MKKYLLFFLAMCFIFFSACNKSNKPNSFYYERNIERIMKSANLFENKINKNAIGLAYFFAQNLSQIKKIDNNVLIFDDSSVWTFISDGKCNNKSSCKILINIPKNNNELVEIPIQFDKQDKFVINNTDTLSEKPIKNKKELRKENTDKEKTYKIYHEKDKINQNNQQKNKLVAQNNDIGDYYNPNETLKWKNPQNIKVYISSKTGKEYIFKEALKIYNNTFQNVIKFTVINYPQDADIEIYYIEYLPKPYWGYTNWKWNTINNTKYITKANIKIALKRNKGTYLSNKYYLLTTLHELGHALGLPHSNNPNDIMFPHINQCCRKNNLSNRDINTLLKIYE